MLNQRRQYQSRELEQLDKIYNELSVLYTNIGSLLETGARPYKIYSALLTQNDIYSITSGSLTVGEQYTITAYVGGVPITLSGLSGGTGYTTGTNVATTGGTGTGLTVDITETAGIITNVVINTPGSDYTESDEITITTGGADATFIISEISSDDFSNCATVVSGDMNTTGCVFIATNTTPNVYTNGSELTSSGIPIVTTLENTTGYDFTWSYVDPGVYECTSSQDLPLDKTIFSTGNNISIDGVWSLLMFNRHSITSALLRVIGDGTLMNGLLDNTNIEIKIYN